VDVFENGENTEGPQEGDVFFPDIDFSKWQLISEEKHEKDEKNAHDYTFKVFERITH
jgi:dihydrofolate reductase